MRYFLKGLVTKWEAGASTTLASSPQQRRHKRARVTSENKTVIDSAQMNIVLRALLCALGDTSIHAVPQNSGVNFGHKEVHTVLEALADILGDHKRDYTVSDVDILMNHPSIVSVVVFSFFFFFL